MKKLLISSILSIGLILTPVISYADGTCDTDVQTKQDSLRKAYIEGTSDLASQNFSKRPGNFATTTCLSTLFKNGGTDIFFKPTNLDTILNMVMKFACQQASEIFSSLTSGSSTATLLAGELLSGVNLSGTLVNISPSSYSSTTSSDTSIKDLF